MVMCTQVANSGEVWGSMDLFRHANDTGPLSVLLEDDGSIDNGGPKPDTQGSSFVNSGSVLPTPTLGADQ